MPVTTIASGGQTGVDRAALDIALSLSVPCQGWCPSGRKAEDGRIPDEYPLQETKSWKYSVRTNWNVRDSDGTLILCIGKLSGGTALTAAEARKQGKPYLIVNLDEQWQFRPVLEWMATHDIQTMNVAGPRESQRPGIYEQATTFLRELITLVNSE